MRRRTHDRRLIAGAVNAVDPIHGPGDAPAGGRLKMAHSFGQFKIRIRKQPVIMIRHHHEGMCPEAVALVGLLNRMQEDLPAFLEGCLKPVLIVRASNDMKGKLCGQWGLFACHT